MMVFQIILLALLLSMLGSIIVYRFGQHFALIDKPNERSSHSISTPRGGGIGIWLTFILIGILFTKDHFFTVIAGITGLIGLIEDSFTLPPKIRLLLQIVVATLAVGLFLGVSASPANLILFLFFIVFLTGTTNFYNFMDGINGIAGLTGFVGFGFIAFFSHFIAYDTYLTYSSIALSAACLGFLPFNFPKAKVFMGDVGSILLGFVFASYVIRLSTNFSIFLCLIMFLSTFYADSIVTIFYRWWRGENIMKAHRSHMYQYMSNELNLAHWKVSIAYTTIQFVFGLLALVAYNKGLIWQIIVFGAFGILFLIAYSVIKDIKPSPDKLDKYLHKIIF